MTVHPLGDDVLDSIRQDLADAINNHLEVVGPDNAPDEFNISVKVSFPASPNGIGQTTYRLGDK